jgi:hypothetical protein
MNHELLRKREISWPIANYLLEKFQGINYCASYFYSHTAAQLLALQFRGCSFSGTSSTYEPWGKKRDFIFCLMAGYFLTKPEGEILLLNELPYTEPETEGLLMRFTRRRVPLS